MQTIIRALWMSPGSPPAGRTGRGVPMADDHVALDAVYREHHVAVRRFAQRLVGDDETADDLVQDVFARLPEALASFRGECGLGTFLTAIVANRARTYVRAAARRRALATRLLREEATETANDPEQSALRDELADRLLLALDKLSLRHRMVVVLCDVEERSSVETASILGVSDATVRTRLFHARRKLRSMLEGAR